jgi:hypothetical protein
MTDDYLADFCAHGVVGFPERGNLFFGIHRLTQGYNAPDANLRE